MLRPGRGPGPAACLRTGLGKPQRRSSLLKELAVSVLEPWGAGRREAHAEAAGDYTKACSFLA